MTTRTTVSAAARPPAVPVGRTTPEGGASRGTCTPGPAGSCGTTTWAGWHPMLPAPGAGSDPDGCRRWQAHNPPCSLSLLYRVTKFVSQYPRVEAVALERAGLRWDQLAILLSVPLDERDEVIGEVLRLQLTSRRVQCQKADWYGPGRSRGGRPPCTACRAEPRGSGPGAFQRLPPTAPPAPHQPRRLRAHAPGSRCGDRTHSLAMSLDRRHFLGTATASAALVGSMAAARAAEPPARPAEGDGRPPVTNPRATSGDTRHGPKWDEMFTLTVGNEKGDLCGRDQRVIQAAVDTVARMGGGTVRLLPGTFRLRNAVYLCSNLRLVGSGPDTVLVKEPSAASKLAADSDWYDQEITLADAKGFQVGDGVCLRAKNPHHGGQTVIKRRSSPGPATASSSTRGCGEPLGQRNADRIDAVPDPQRRVHHERRDREPRLDGNKPTTRSWTATTPAASSCRTAPTSPSAG